MGKKVAVIDDNREFLDFVKSVLEPEGYQVIPILGSLRAREIVKESAPDLVLLDIMMPGRSGWELLDILKLDPATQEIPIIVITAMKAFTARVQRDKIRDVLRKPFDIDVLVEKVRVAIGDP